MSVLKPQPRVSEITRPFWQGCNDGRLVMQRCQDRGCGKTVFYPRVCCPHCHGADLAWVEVACRGSIVSHTTIHRPHHDGFNAELPYVFAAIGIDGADGALMYAQVPGAPTDGTSLVGRPVRVEFVAHGPDRQIPICRLVEQP